MDRRQQDRGESSGSDKEGWIVFGVNGDRRRCGVSIAWDYCDTVALDSQGVIQWIYDIVDRRETGSTDGGEPKTAAPTHLRGAIKGLTYLVTDKGPNASG